MTYDQYWYGDVNMAKAYREADKLRQERTNTEAWLQGMYIYDLLTRVGPFPMVWVDGKKEQRTDYMPEPYLFGESRKDTPEVDQEEIEKKKAQVRGLQAKLFSSP